MPLHTVTEKRLELARKSALDRLARNIDDAIITCALDLRIEPEALVKSHISATKERLGSLGLKLNDTRYGRPNEAVLDAVKREAPTHETLIDAAMRRWNENAAALDAKIRPRAPAQAISDPAKPGRGARLGVHKLGRWRLGSRHGNPFIRVGTGAVEGQIHAGGYSLRQG